MVSARSAPGSAVQPADACPACGGELRPWRSVAASDPALDGLIFELRRCQGCGSAVTVGEEPEQLYETGAYRRGTPRLHALARPVLQVFDRQRLALLREVAPPPARLLDVGAGRGRFVLSARRAGYDATGIEPSQRGLEAAAEAGVPVLPASIAGADVEPSSLDAATLWHVLEHLNEPAGALAEIHSWLRPGGALLVGVPNLASLQARLGIDNWYHLDVPRHRVHFTPQGLRALLERTGFTPIRTHHLLFEHNPFGMWQSFVSLLTTEPSYLYNLLKRNAAVHARDLTITLGALPLAPVAALAEALAAAFGRGGTIAVLARREGYH